MAGRAIFVGDELVVREAQDFPGCGRAVGDQVHAPHLVVTPSAGVLGRLDRGEVVRLREALDEWLQRFGGAR